MSLGLADEVRAGFRNVVVASIGPTTSEMLRNEDLPVDMEPSHPKMGHLVNEAAERAGEILARKRRIASESRCDCGQSASESDRIRNPNSQSPNFDPLCTTARSCVRAAASRPNSRPSG